MSEIIFWGAGGQAKVLRECVSHAGFQLVALFDNDPDVPAPFPDVPLWHGPEGFGRWLADRTARDLPHFLVAIGGQGGGIRLELHDFLNSRGLRPIVARHPESFVAEGVQIGAGSQILARAMVSVEVTIGRQCIINHSTNVDHECRLADGVHVCPGATLAGLVEVGRNAMVGSGAVVLPRIRIGDDAIVGAGAVVTRDVPAGAVVVGNPARAAGDPPYTRP